MDTLDTTSNLSDWPNARYQNKIDEFKKLGFNNPSKLMVAHPTISGLSIDNVKMKIQGLLKLQFLNPIKLITEHPPNSRVFFREHYWKSCLFARTWL